MKEMQYRCGGKEDWGGAQDNRRETVNDATKTKKQHRTHIKYKSEITGRPSHCFTDVDKLQKPHLCKNE